MNKQKGNSFLNGAILLTASSLIVKILGMLYKVPLSYILTDEGMGYFNAAYSVYTFFYIICTAGVPKAMSILTSEAESRGDTRLMRRTYRTAFYMFFTLSAVASIFFFLLAGPISKITASPSSRLAMMGITPSILFVCASGVLRGYFNGRLNMLPIAVSEVISGCAKLVLGLGLAVLSARLGAELYVVAFFTVLGTTFGSLFGFAYLLIVKKRENIREKTRQNYLDGGFSISIFKRIVAKVLPLTLASTVGAVSNIADLSIIMPRLVYSGYSELQAGIIYGNYTTLAVPMLNLVGTVVAPISAVVLPIVSAGDGLRCDECKKRVKYAVSLILAFSIPMAIVMTVCPYEVLTILFDDSSAILAAPFLSILALSIPFMSYLTIFNTVLEGSGRIKLSLISLVCCSAVKLLSSYFFVGSINIGPLGAPISTLLGYSIGLLVAFLFSGKEIRRSISSFGTDIKYFLFAFVSFLPLVILKIFLATIPTPFFIFIGALSALIYVTLCVIFDKNGILLSK